MMKHYTKLKEECMELPQCYCPESDIVQTAIAETPEYLRHYFVMRGREQLKKEIIDAVAVCIAFGAMVFTIVMLVLGMIGRV